jgi:hypothetical protein
MRKLTHPLWYLIIFNIVLLIGTLYVTRHAISDYEFISYSQRNHFKSVAMLQMANAYLHSPAYKFDDGVGMGKFLEQTTHDKTESFMLFKWEPEKGFPIIYIGGNRTAQKYYDVGNLKASLETSNRLGTTQKAETDALYNKILTCTPSINLSAPYILTGADGVKYLATWVIIPTPVPSKAIYLYMAFTPTASIDTAILEIKNRYIWLFGFATALAGIMLVLIPMVIKRDIYDHR